MRRCFLCGKRGVLHAVTDSDPRTPAPCECSTRASEASRAATTVVLQNEQQSSSRIPGLFGLRLNAWRSGPRGRADLQAAPRTEETSPEPDVREPPLWPQKKHETGTAQTCILIVKSFLGGAFLFLPRALLTGGVLLSVCTMVFVFLMALYCVHLLLRCCTTEGNDTYEQLGEKAFGAWGRFIVEMCVVLSQLSFCTINAVVVWGNLRDVIWTVSGCSPAHKWSVVTLLWLGALYFIPASLITNMKHLAPLMLIGNVGMGVGVLLLLVSVSLVHPAEFWTGVDALASWENWPIVIGTSIFMWEGAALLVPIRNSAARKVQDRFPLLLSICLGALIMLYVGYSLFCIAVFGQQLKVVILANLSPGPLGLTVQSLFALSVMATYPLLLSPASNIAEERVMPDRRRVSSRTYTLLRSLLRSTLVIVTLLAATVGLKQLDSFVAFAGSLCGAPLTFLCPPLFHVKLQKGTPTLLMILHCAIILFGACIVIFSVYWTIATWRGSDDFPARCSGSYE